MPNEASIPDLLGDLECVSTDIACRRVEEIETSMRHAPDVYPEYTKAREDIEREQASLIQKLNGDDFALEPLIKAMMAYHSELIFEVYKQAVLDGGRIYHAFVTNELPIKEGAK